MVSATTGHHSVSPLPRISAHTDTHTRRPVSRSTKTVRKPYENRKRLLRKTLGNGNENVNFKPPKENYGFRCGFIWLCLMKRVKRPPTVFVRFSYGFRTVFVGLRVFQRFLITACCCEAIWFKQRKILGPLHRTCYLA